MLSLMKTYIFILPNLSQHFSSSKSSLMSLLLAAGFEKAVKQQQKNQLC